MRKLVFSALAFVAFAGSSFASNEIVSDFESDKTNIVPCRATVYIINHNGEIVVSESIEIDTSKPSDCESAGEAFLEEVRSYFPGYRAVLNLNWGE